MNFETANNEQSRVDLRTSLLPGGWVAKSLSCGAVRFPLYWGGQPRVPIPLGYKGGRRLEDIRLTIRSAEAWRVPSYAKATAGRGEGENRGTLIYVLCCSRCEGARNGRAGMSVPAYRQAGY